MLSSWDLLSRLHLNCLFVFSLIFNLGFSGQIFLRDWHLIDFCVKNWVEKEMVMNSILFLWSNKCLTRFPFMSAFLSFILISFFVSSIKDSERNSLCVPSFLLCFIIPAWSHVIPSHPHCVQSVMHHLQACSSHTVFGYRSHPRLKSVLNDMSKEEIVEPQMELKIRKSEKSK